MNGAGGIKTIVIHHTHRGAARRRNTVMIHCPRRRGDGRPTARITARIVAAVAAT